MEHIIGFSNNYEAIPLADLSSATTKLGRLIDWLTYPLVTTRPQSPIPGSRHCSAPTRHCLKHGVNCPRFSPLTPV